jgi:hypothetical protein
VRVLFWTQLAWSAWAEPTTFLADTTAEGALWPLISRSAYAQPATVLSGTTVEGAALSSVDSVGVGSASHCGSGHDR